MDTTQPGDVLFQTNVDTIEVRGEGWVRFLYQCGTLGCTFALPPDMAQQFAREQTSSVTNAIQAIRDEDRRREKGHPKLIVPNGTL